MVNGCVRRVQNWLLARSCPGCLGRVRTGRDFCAGCEGSLPYISTACPRCAIPLAGGGGHECGPCQRKPPPFERAVALFRYDDPVRGLIHDLKYGGQIHLARLFGELLVERLAGAGGHPDRIIPMPLHPRRLRERGYNQSLEIARPVARRLGLPLDYDTLTRIRPTVAQADLPLEERARNVRGAFAAAGRLKGLRVALLDDVLTTGHTATAAARALRRAGAVVELWVIARAGY